MTITYIINAPFTASYQSISNSQVLDTAGEGVTTGSLTSVVSSSTLSIANNSLRMIQPVVGAALTNCGVYTTNSFANAPGLAVMGKFSNPEVSTPGTQSGGNTGTSCFMSINSAATPIGTGKSIASIFHAGTSTSRSWRTAGYLPASLCAFRTGDGNGTAVENSEHWPIGPGATYEFCIVMGGYNSSGVPYQGGDASSYTYGARYYLRGGEHLQPVLMGTNKSTNPTTLYASIAGSSGDTECADFKIVNADTSFIQQPTSYFATTSLNDQFTHSANCVIEFDLTRPASGQVAIRFRKSSNVFGSGDRLSFSVDSDGTCRIAKSIGGVTTTYTENAEASSGTIPSGSNRIQIVCDGRFTRVYILNSTSTSPIYICEDTSTASYTNAEISAMGSSGSISKLAFYDRYPSNSAIEQVYGTLSFVQGSSYTDFSTLKNTIINDIWSGSNLPTTVGMTKTASVTNILNKFVGGSFVDMTPSNLLQTDSWQFDVDNGSGGNATLDVTDTTSYTGRITVTKSKQVYLWRPTTATSNGKAVIVHGGHGYEWTLFARSSADVDNLATDAYSTPWAVKSLVEAGYTVVGIKMHDHEGNVVADVVDPVTITGTLNMLKYFIEPTIRVVNALIEEGFSNIFMTGTSGGAWTTMMCAAVDSRIKATVSSCGGLPLYFNDLNIHGEHVLPGFSNLHVDFQDLFVLGCMNRRKIKNFLVETDPTIGAKSIYDKSLLPHGDLITTASSIVGGSYSFEYDTTNDAHGFSDYQISKMITFFDSYSASTSGSASTSMEFSNSFQISL